MDCRQLRWAGHVARMDHDARLPRKMLSSCGSRRSGRPVGSSWPMGSASAKRWTCSASTTRHGPSLHRIALQNYGDDCFDTSAIFGSFCAIIFFRQGRHLLSTHRDSDSHIASAPTAGRDDALQDGTPRFRGGHVRCTYHPREQLGAC